MDHTPTPEVVLHAERARAATERVATGKLTLRKKVVTEEVTVPVTLRRDELVVDEDIFDVPRAAEVNELPDGDLEIVLYAERPVVTVEVVPVERVRIRRGVISEVRSVDVDLQREEAVIEHEGDVHRADAGRRAEH